MSKTSKYWSCSHLCQINRVINRKWNCITHLKLNVFHMTGLFCLISLYTQYEGTNHFYQTNQKNVEGNISFMKYYKIRFGNTYIKRKLYQRCYGNRIKLYSVTLIQMHLNNISSLCTIWKCINVPVVKLNSILIPLFMLFPFGSFLHYTSTCLWTLSSYNRSVHGKNIVKFYEYVYLKWKML